MSYFLWNEANADSVSFFVCIQFLVNEQGNGCRKSTDSHAIKEQNVSKLTTVQRTSMDKLNLHPNSPNTQLGVNKLVLKKIIPTRNKQEKL